MGTGVTVRAPISVHTNPLTFSGPSSHFPYCPAPLSHPPCLLSLTSHLLVFSESTALGGQHLCHKAKHMTSGGTLMSR